MWCSVGTSGGASSLAPGGAVASGVGAVLSHPLVLRLASPRQPGPRHHQAPDAASQAHATADLASRSRGSSRRHCQWHVEDAPLATSISMQPPLLPKAQLAPATLQRRGYVLCASAAPASADVKLEPPGQGEEKEKREGSTNGGLQVANGKDGPSSSDKEGAQLQLQPVATADNGNHAGSSDVTSEAALAAAMVVAAQANGATAEAAVSSSSTGFSKDSNGDAQSLQQLLQQLREALDGAQRESSEAQARAQQAELKSQEAQDAMAQAQELYTDLNKQYSELSEQLEALRSSRGGSNGGSGGRAGSGEVSAELGRQVEDLQAQLEDMDYRLGWALRDLRAHQLVLRAQGELSLHLSGLPASLQQQVFEQVDSGAELLGDGGSATVHAVTIHGQQLAVKVMPLYDINTARPYHFRDICTTFLRHERSPHIELPLHTFLRLKDDEVEGTQYFLYTVWPRRHMDVDQLLCTRPLQHEEVMTVMHHTVLALLDLAKARMVHADVKPPNILVMLGADGLVSSAHLTDFGSVQFVPQGEEAAPAIWDGQLAWNWPPEQRDSVHLEACDAWGLALLYSCMKVHNPSKPNVTDVLQDLASNNQAEFERVRDHELLPDDPSDPPEMRSLTRLMRRCVVKDPKKRPGVRELVGAIQVLREQMQMQRRAAQAAAAQRR